MADIAIAKPNADSYVLSSWNTHLIDPDKKDAAWGYNIFVANKHLLKTIYGGWYNGDAQLVRLFANGNQPESRYKVLFDPQDQNGIYMGGAIGGNWTIAPVIPVLRARVLAELDNIPLEVDCQAIDPIANEARNMDMLRLKAQPILDAKLAQLSQKMGYQQPMKSGFDKQILTSPVGNGQAQQGGMGIDLSDDEEIGILMDKDAGYYSQKIEMANEIAIQSIFQYNEIDKLFTLCKQDAFDLGICCYRCFMNSYTGLPQFQYLDPAQIYVMGSKFKDFHDSPFWYYKVPATLADVLTYFGNTITEQEAKDIWEHSAKRRPVEWNGGFPHGYGWDWRRWDTNSLLKVEIDAYYFEVRTNDVVTYEASVTKNGNTKRKKKTIAYEPPEESQYNKQKENYWAECWYSGFYIQGLTKVYKWEKLYNQQRDDFDPQKSHSSLNIYRFSDKGLTEQVIAFADDYQTTFLKRKHMIVKALPKGYSFNVDALSDIDMGTAGTITREKLIQMYLQTGSTLHKTLDEMGSPIMANSNAPHMELKNGIDEHIIEYTNIMQSLKTEIASTFGIPPVDVSVNPQADALVGVQKAAMQASINSRHFLYVGFQKLVEQTATRVSCYIQEIAEQKSSAWDKIKAMVGNSNAALIDNMGSLPLHTFGVFAKNSASESEKQEFRQMVMQAYQRGNLQISDVLAIWWIPNLKLSVAMLNLKMKKQMALSQQMEMQKLQYQQQIEQSSNQIKLQNTQMITEAQKSVADANGKYLLISTEMKEIGDMNRKLLQEISKLNLAHEKQTHDHSIEDKANAQTLTEIAAQQENDMALKKQEGQNQIDAIEAQPTQPAAA